MEASQVEEAIVHLVLNLNARWEVLTNEDQDHSKEDGEES